jgi:hypothetical protein
MSAIANRRPLGISYLLPNAVPNSFFVYSFILIFFSFSRFILTFSPLAWNVKAQIIVELEENDFNMRVVSCIS